MSRLCFAFIAAAAVGASANGAVFYFTDHGAFQAFNAADGKVLKGIEDFEESTIDPGGKSAFPNPLMHGLPRPFFDNGIDETNLIIQTNITPHPLAPLPNPGTSQNSLYVNGAGFLGSNSNKVGTDEFLNNLLSSLDLIFTTHDKTGVGVDLSRYQGFGNNGFVIGVYDAANNLLGSYLIPGPVPVEPTKVFFGVWSDVPIGRLNIWGDDMVPSPFAVDNIEMWIPSPGAALALGLGALAAGRRRR